MAKHITKEFSYGSMDYKVEIKTVYAYNLIKEIDYVDKEAEEESTNGNYYGASEVLNRNDELLDELFENCVHWWSACPADRLKGVWRQAK